MVNSFSFTSHQRNSMYRRDVEAFKNPIQLVRPLTVNSSRRFDRTINDDSGSSKHRPKTSGIESSKKYSDFHSASSSTNFSFGSDHDTDIEDDIDEVEDELCLGVYKRICQVENLIPVKKYLDHYKDKEFSLRYYGLGPRGMRGFIPSLTMNQYITKLDLGSNGLGDEGVVYLAHILRDNASLDDINLSQNFIGIDGAEELCKLFKEDHIRIKNLHLEGNLFDDKCACLFAEVIANSGLFQSLNFSRNRFGSESGVYFGKALTYNTSVRSFDLSWNSINGKGAIALIKGVQKNDGLEILNLAHNGLSGAECGRAWKHALIENSHLIELNLSHNRLTAEPATFIGTGLAKNESLQTISLTGNPLESAGCYAILKPLIGKNAQPNQLKLIDLSGILINRDFRELYQQVLDKRPELEILIALKTPPALRKSRKRAPPPAMERLQTLFQRRPDIDLTDFFFSVANDADDTDDNRIKDPHRFKQAIQEKFTARFSDQDIEEILKEVSQFDCKKFIQTFDNRPIIASLSSSSWRFKSSS